MLYDISKQNISNNYKVAYYGYLYKGKMTILINGKKVTFKMKK